LAEAAAARVRVWRSFARAIGLDATTRRALEGVVFVGIRSRAVPVARITEAKREEANQDEKDGEQLHGCSVG
jgi:hypothetical protein